MSYVKPVKQCQDAPVGFRQINEIVNNQGEALAAFEAEHSGPNGDIFIGPMGTWTTPPTAPTPNGTIELAGAGVHDTPKVARGTMGIAVATATSIGAPTVHVTYRSGVCQGISRIGTGVYFIPITGLSEFYADVMPMADDNAATRLVQQSPTSATASTGTTTVVPGIYVTTWEETTLNSSNLGFAVADFGFHVIVYGRSYAFNPGADGFGWPILGHRPRRVNTSPRSGVFYVGT